MIKEAFDLPDEALNSDDLMEGLLTVELIGGDRFNPNYWDDWGDYLDGSMSWDDLLGE